jgi:RNA polymerase sigma-B factor
MIDEGSLSDEPRSDDDEAVRALFDRIPDPRARAELVGRFRPFADYLARKFAGRGESLEDLQQVASIGLLNAIDRFDQDRGVRFSTYAAATIVGELKRHFRDKGWAMRVPRRLQELAVRLNQMLPELTQQLGRSPTIPELAAELGIEPEEVVEAMDAVHAYSTASIESPTGTEGLSPMETMGQEDPSIALIEGWATIAPAVRDLPERERRVLYFRFIRGMTQSEIAAEIGVSQMHVSRILSQTLDKLRTEVSG